MRRLSQLLPFLLFVASALIATSCATSFSDRASDILEPYRLPDAPGGAVLVVDRDSILVRDAFGFADVEARVPNAPATNFRLASVTKQFTAMCVLILRDRSLLHLDDAITDFFPEGPPIWRSITVRHLLTHSSGLVDYEDVMAESTIVPLLDRDVLRLARSVDTTYFVPGSRYQYSNTGYALLALIVERTSGLTFASFLRKEIFEPTGMSGTVAFENGISTVERRAFGYTPTSEGSPRFDRTDQSMTSSVLGDGGIYSSVIDLLQWHRSLLTATLVRRPTLEEAFAPHIVSPDSTVRYGYGWMIGEMEGWKVLSHSGSTIGFRNFILRIPERKMVVIVLMNRANGDAEHLARSLAAECLRRKE